MALSAHAISNDFIFELTKRLSPDQKVVFILMSACMWELLEFTDGGRTILPRRSGKPVTLDSIRDKEMVWHEIGTRLISLFPEPLADEDPTKLTPAEAAVIESHKPAPLSPGTALKGAELVRAYYDK